LRQLIWSGPACRDLLAIAEHYGTIDSDLTAEILRAVEQAPVALPTHPDIGAPTDRRGLRKWPVKNTSFQLFYSAKRERVEIIRVRHATEDWRRA